jgi:hypothetical protein
MPGLIFFAAILLTQDKWALVDLEDFERATKFKWRASLDSRGTKWYAKRRRLVSEKDSWPAQQIRLHHFVLGVSPHRLPPGFVIDHKNHESLDCRKSNLEEVTQEENMHRSKGWKKKPEEPCL